jgi:hypothetical protein
MSFGMGVTTVSRCFSSLLMKDDRAYEQIYDMTIELLLIVNLYASRVCGK